MSYYGSSVAARVRRNKEAHPERYCKNLHCLWNTLGGVKPCPKHPIKVEPVAVECVVCFDPITADQQSFVVPAGRCHEGRCRSEFNAMMVEQEGRLSEEKISGANSGNYPFLCPFLPAKYGMDVGEVRHRRPISLCKPTICR